MKNLACFFAVVLASMIVNFGSVFSQQPWEVPCLPDCFDQPFGARASYYMTLPNCPTCTLEVRYRTRTACPPTNYQDLFIESVWSSCMYTCLLSGYGNDLKAFLQAVSEQMLIKNPMNFHPLPGEPCADNWRVMKGSCWTKDVITAGSGGQLAHACTTSYCCLEMYRVCLDQNGNRIVTQTGYQSPADPECLVGGSSTCVPVCGSIYR